MGIEQRQYERIVIAGDVLINHQNSTIECQIENISNYGAYLKVGNNCDPYCIEIGDNVTFNITTPKKPAKELSGQILRLTMEEETTYLAVYFFHPYDFD